MTAASNTRSLGVLPLSGITVVSIEQAIAAPFASRQLADLGARVIKVERPQTGDFARHYDAQVHGMSSQFVWTNRSKESVTLDLKSDEGRNIVRALLNRTDVLIQNLSPGAMERLGFGAHTLRSQHPHLIVCSISGYGPTGPYRERKAYDLLIQAESGLLSITGGANAPAKAGIAVADIAAGMYAFAGILAALYERSRTGEGSHIEVSLLDALAEWMGYPAYYTMYGEESLPRTEAHHASIAPYGPYESNDGQTVIFAIQNAREWERFCSTVMEAPEIATDSRFATNPERVRNRTSLDIEINKRLRDFNFDQLTSRLAEANIAFGRARSVDEFVAHPQLESRQRWRNVPSPAGNVRMLLPPINSDTYAPHMGGIPELGAHTFKVLKELGYTDEFISELKYAGKV